MTLHAGRDVDCIAPQVIRELMDSNHARYHRAGVDSDAKLQGFPITRLTTRRSVKHIESDPDARLCVVGAPPRQPGNRHIGVANCLYFLDAMLLSEPVEVRHQP